MEAINHPSLVITADDIHIRSIVYKLKNCFKSFYFETATCQAALSLCQE